MPVFYRRPPSARLERGPWLRGGAPAADGHEHMNRTSVPAHDAKQNLLPLLTGLLLCMFMVVIWRALEKHEVASRHEAVRMESRRVLDIIEVDINHRIQALERIVNR